MECHTSYQSLSFPGQGRFCGTSRGCLKYKAEILTFVVTPKNFDIRKKKKKSCGDARIDAPLAGLLCAYCREQSKFPCEQHAAGVGLRVSTLLSC